MVVLVRPGTLRVLLPPGELVTIEGKEADAARQLLERASVAPIDSDADDGYDGRLIVALRESGVLTPAPGYEPSPDASWTGAPAINVLLGITGAIDAVRAPAYLRVLREQADLDVKVVLTQAATRFVSPDALGWYSGMPVAVDLFEGGSADHVVLAEWTDVVAVVPAAAEFLCRLAAGGYSDLLSATIAVASGPVVLAPATNEKMWRRQAVQRALRSLTEEGFEIVLPGAGAEVSDPEHKTGFGGVGVAPEGLPLLLRLLTRTTSPND